MKSSVKLPVLSGWKIVLADLNIDTSEVLKHADLPNDIFTRKGSMLNIDECIRFWNAIESISADPEISLKLIKSLSTESFDPAIFSALCSPNLTTALNRLKKFKPIIGPMSIDLEEREDATTIVMAFQQKSLAAPAWLVAVEIGFFIQLARIATREHIVPTEVCVPCQLPVPEKFNEYFGVTVTPSNKISLTFSKEDCQRAFVTENQSMWQFFEPNLNKHLAELTSEDNFSCQARAAMLDMLPCGEATLPILAERLNLSRRTLQRRLQNEGTNFQGLLTEVRKDLAKHYVVKSTLPYNHISFLLGYEDPNSFFRAFHQWTGVTPDSMRNKERNNEKNTTQEQVEQQDSANISASSSVVLQSEHPQLQSQDTPPITVTSNAEPETCVATQPQETVTPVATEIDKKREKAEPVDS